MARSKKKKMQERRRASTSIER
uniref:Uncharacterized protein n=1 Tax=Arundo donax TaxID=35708 RepID=A0A0A9A1Y1_ARUDO